MNIKQNKEIWKEVKNFPIDPEFLICTSFDTHQAIEFGDKKKLIYLPKERRKGDTTLWR